MKSIVIQNGHELPLGCSMEESSTLFNIYAPHAYAMVLEIYDKPSRTTPIFKEVIPTQNDTGYFCIRIYKVKASMCYTWRIMYENLFYSPSLLDPYAKALTYISSEWRNIIISNNKPQIIKPHVPWNKTIIYELHVGHFTKGDLTLPEEERGTFLGLSKKLPYLKALGITSIELLPIFKWYAHLIKNKNPYTGESLEDVWGYNPIAYFALDERYSVGKTSQDSLEEFKMFLESAHQYEIEVLLDVVYNHSGEGGTDGISAHFKYLAPEVYYKYDDQHVYLNCSGTGNTLNTNHPIVKKLIKDSLTYWVQEVGVDGFRFDLASILGQDDKGRWLKESLLHEIAVDPILSNTKLITESWDAKGSYDVGRMPIPFCEWSDYFRDTVRKFVKGNPGIVPAVADCMMGKEIYFTDPGKNKQHTIHFITAHDGYTMWDLVSYNDKHNEANGEANRDGHNANHSYNWGVEGETTDTTILQRRVKAMKMLMSFLLLSQGIPMILMGDEVARSQGGNNNAFCQDHPSIWMKWSLLSREQDMLSFTQQLIKMRNQLDYYAHSNCYKVSWHGIHYNQPDWSYYSSSMAAFIEGRESLFWIANSYYEPLVFELPNINGKWECILNTDSSSPFTSQLLDESNYTVAAHTLCLFIKH